MTAATAPSTPPAPLPAPGKALYRDPFPFALLAQAVGIFSLVGAALALCAATAGVDDASLPSFLQSNVLPDSIRTRLFVAFVVGGGCGGLFALVYVAIRGRSSVPGLRQAGDVIAPLVVTGVLPSLFSAKPWHDKPTTFMVGMAAVVLATEVLMRRSLRAVPPAFADWISEKLTFRPSVARWLPFAVVLAGFLFYSVYFSYYTILNHQRLNTSGFDLGIHVNWAFNAMRGFPARCPVLFGPDGGHFLGNHAIFAMALWLPLFSLWPSAEILLILQATMAGLGAVTLYMFASTQTTRWSAVVIAYAYLFFAPLHGPNFYDFHELIPPLPFHFLLYWAIAKRKNWAVALLVPLLWSFREDVAVGITVLGAFLLVTGLRPRMGFFMALASVVWFVILKFEVMPRFWQTWFASIYKDLQAPGRSGYGTVVQTILINPAYFLSTLLKEEKLIYFLHMFGPLALLPARRWALLVLAIPGFAFSMLTTGYAPTISIAFQYTCHSIPYVFAATVLMVRLIGEGPEGILRRRAVLTAVALGIAVHSYVFGAILQHETFVGGFTRVEFTMSAQDKARYAMMKAMAAAIPQEASVAASENEVPHVSARLNAYTIKDGAAPDADYILVNIGQMGGATRTAVTQMFSRAQYGIVMRGHGLFLFKRGHQSPDTKAAVSALGLKYPKQWRASDNDK
jgi:uncharacterized membrane protein